MKNRGAVLILIGFLTSLILVSCKNLNNEDLARIESLESRIDQLEEERDKALEERDLALGELESMRLENQIESDLFITIVDKINIEKDPDSWVFSSRVKFPMTLKNNSDREIEKLEARVYLKDKSSVDILDFQADLDGLNLQPGEMINLDSLELEINDYLEEHRRLYELDFEDLLINYELKNIVFK